MYNLGEDAGVKVYLFLCVILVFISDGSPTSLSVQ